MTTRPDNVLKRLLLDISGILLLIMALMVGWLPGPAGIPLTIAGLSLLAINHEWAKRLLEKVRAGGVKFMDKIFSDSPAAKVVVDMASMLLLALAALLYTRHRDRIFLSAAVFLALMAAILFLGNRKRHKWLLRFAKGNR